MTIAGCPLIVRVPGSFGAWWDHADPVDIPDDIRLGWLEKGIQCRVTVWADTSDISRRIMSTPLIERRIDTLVDFATFLAGQDGPRWYRGIGDSTYDLVPGLYRHRNRDSAYDLLKLEVDIIQRFRLRSVPYRVRSSGNENNWDLLFLMQHYGVPTRLLDWTENPYFGLYFALTQAKYEKTPEGPVYNKDAAIWVLNNTKWNNEALGYDVPEALTAENATADNYGPGRGPEAIARREPIAIYGSYNSPRIVAQKGVFTMFGNSLTPMETIFEQGNFSQDCLTRLIIPSQAIGQLLRQLTGIGITDSVVFPDLEGLAREIKRHFEYWT